MSEPPTPTTIKERITLLQQASKHSTTLSNTLHTISSHRSANVLYRRDNSNSYSDSDSDSANNITKNKLDNIKKDGTNSVNKPKAEKKKLGSRSNSRNNSVDNKGASTKQKSQSQFLPSSVSIISRGRQEEKDRVFPRQQSVSSIGDYSDESEAVDLSDERETSITVTATDNENDQIKKKIIVNHIHTLSNHLCENVVRYVIDDIDKTYVMKRRQENDFHEEEEEDDEDDDDSVTSMRSHTSSMSRASATSGKSSNSCASTATSNASKAGGNTFAENNSNNTWKSKINDQQQLQLQQQLTENEGTDSSWGAVDSFKITAAPKRRSRSYNESAASHGDSMNDYSEQTLSRITRPVTRRYSMATTTSIPRTTSEAKTTIFPVNGTTTSTMPKPATAPVTMPRRSSIATSVGKPTTMSATTVPAISNTSPRSPHITFGAPLRTHSDGRNLAPARIKRNRRAFPSRTKSTDTEGERPRLIRTKSGFDAVIDTSEEAVERNCSFGMYSEPVDNNDNKNPLVGGQGYRKQRRRMRTLTAMKKLESALGTTTTPAANVVQGLDDGTTKPASSTTTTGATIGASKIQNSTLSLRQRKSKLKRSRATATSSSDNNSNMLSMMQPLVPPAIRYDCALLFVDISGFTKLSTALKVEHLSKTINSYFHLIVEEVRAFGGDIIKFAGDALFASWQCSSSRPFVQTDKEVGDRDNVDNWNGLTEEKAVLTAAACACQIIGKCANYNVYGDKNKNINHNDNDNDDNNDHDITVEDKSKHYNSAPVATLNLHCSIGVGELIGVHVGNNSVDDRMEYLILGDPIRQVTDAINVGKLGEVVASPEAINIMNMDSAENSSSSATPKKNNVTAKAVAPDFVTEPQVILSKTNTFSNTKFLFVRRKKVKKTFRDRFSINLMTWNLFELQKLQSRLSAYVHPVVVDMGMSSFYNSKREEERIRFIKEENEERHKRFQSEAEIRSVFTIFIQALVPGQIISGENIEVRSLILLNEIMVLVNRELTRFKGHLRQFIVDDKGVVLIANFGLRGSTFPKMIERLAMPFASSVQPLLESELGIESRMGATFGKAYCGVVGGIARHEYAVLGPSVNLAARLMANPKNEGFLVDEACREKAEGHPFKSLPPVKAKGYVNPVPIFEPLIHQRRSWQDTSTNFVGRKDELIPISKLAQNIIDSETVCKMVLISAESGYGKSTLLTHATEEIQKSCESHSLAHIIICQVACEDDIFQPLSVIGPIFIDILAVARKDESDKKLERGMFRDKLLRSVNNLTSNLARRRSVFQLVGVCRELDIPDECIETLCSLVINHSWPEETEQKQTNQIALENIDIARFIVRVILHCSLDFDFILIGIDDIMHMDVLSWKVVELLFEHACNLMVIGTSLPVSSSGSEIFSVDKKFWNEHLFPSHNFVHIELGPLDQVDIDELCALVQEKGTLDENNKASRQDLSSRSVYAQSGGIPQLAMDIIAGNASGKSTTSNSKGVAAEQNQNDKQKRTDTCSISEAMLHRMDQLSSSERTHMNLGAIFGSSFELLDVIRVMELYRGLNDDKDRDAILKHAESVHDSLNDAVAHGILEECKKSNKNNAGVEGAVREASRGSGDPSHSPDSVGAGSIMFANDHPYAKNNITYRFTHEDWRKNLLTLTLDDWKRDMYKLISRSLEALLENENAQHKVVVKRLFGLWKETSGNLGDAVDLALRVGKILERSRRGNLSLEIYRKAMKLISNDAGRKKSNGNSSSSTVSSDITWFLNLHIAMGRVALKLLDLKTAITEFQAASTLVNDSATIKNRSVIFPAYCGLFCVLRLATKRDVQFEEVLVDTFVTEADQHRSSTPGSDSIHCLRSLAMQAEMLGRHGRFEDAVNRCSELRTMYNATQHSARLSKCYAEDHCAQCIAQSALWQSRLFSQREAVAVSEDVIYNILPSITPNDSVGLFLTVYPILWVLKDNGMSNKAHDTFKSFVVEKVKGQNPFETLYVPILMLLDLAATKGRTNQRDEYIQWAMATNNGKFDAQMNIYTSNLGRTADSITAEICLLLLGEPDLSDVDKLVLSKKGMALAQKTLRLTSANVSTIENNDNGLTTSKARVVSDESVVRSEPNMPSNAGMDTFSTNTAHLSKPGNKPDLELNLACTGMEHAYDQVKPIYDALSKL